MRHFIKRMFIVIVFMVLLGVGILHGHSLYKGRQLDKAFENKAINQFDVVTIDGTDVAYRSYGDKSHEAMVFVHGFLGSSYDYRHIVTAFFDDYYVMAIDLVGFGHSDKPLDFSYTTIGHAVLLHEVLEALDITAYHLLAHSMGARVGLYHTYLYPDGVMSLTLISPAGIEDREVSRIPPKFFYDYIFKNYTLQRLAFRDVNAQDAYRDSRYFDPLYYFSKDIPAKILQKMNQDQATIDWTKILDTITTETLIVVGEKDTWTPLSISEIYEEKLENTRLITIPDTGHLPMIESSDRLIEAIQIYLS